MGEDRTVPASPWWRRRRRRAAAELAPSRRRRRRRRGRTAAGWSLRVEVDSLSWRAGVDRGRRRAVVGVGLVRAHEEEEEIGARKYSLCFFFFFLSTSLVFLARDPGKKHTRLQEYRMECFFFLLP